MLNYQRVVRWFTYQSWGFFHSYASLPEGKDEIRWWTIGWWIIWLLYSIVFGKRNGWWIGDWYPHQTPIISQAGATLLCTPWFLELYGHERSKTREKKNKNKNMKLDQRSHGGLMDYEWLWHIILICICVYIYIYIYMCIYIYIIYIYIFSICLQKLRWPLVLPFFGTHMGGRTSPQNCRRVQVMSCNPALLNACGGQFFFLCQWGMGACVLHIVSKKSPAGWFWSWKPPISSFCCLD